MFKRMILAVALGLAAGPVVVQASGGSGSGGSGGSAGGGGGSTTGVTIRLIGYATAVDYANSRIQIGQLYYGSGLVTVNSTTKITINNVAATFDDIVLNDFCEVRYDSVSRIASKIAVTR